jgi:2-hydroxychromene-2-carboxylate isomerase
MTNSVDLYWSFRSPYSYLATGRIVDLAATYDIDIAVRVVRPIAIRDPNFFQRVDPRLPPYVVMDSKRVAEMAGIPFRWPRPDPVVMDMKTRAIAADQPYIHRLNRMGIAATRAGHGLAFLDEVSRLIWTGDVDDWHEGDHLANAAARAGLDIVELETAARDQAEDLDAELVRNEDALSESGHWGVPTLVYDGEPFFGQDRLALLEWRLTQSGVNKR